MELRENLVVLLVLVALMVGNILLKRRRADRTPLEMAANLLADINRNQKLAGQVQFNLKVGKFSTGSWQRNQKKLDFLGEPLKANLASAFGIAAEFNRDIDLARKSKSAAYLSGLGVDKIREPLAKSKQGLEEWLRANAGKQPLFRRRGLFG